MSATVFVSLVFYGDFKLLKTLFQYKDQALDFSSRGVGGCQKLGDNGLNKV